MCRTGQHKSLVKVPNMEIDWSQAGRYITFHLNFHEAATPGKCASCGHSITFAKQCYRCGVILHSEDCQKLVTWSCRRTIPPMRDIPVSDKLVVGKLVIADSAADQCHHLASGLHLLLSTEQASSNLLLLILEVLPTNCNQVFTMLFLPFRTVLTWWADHIPILDFHLEIV